MLEHLPAMLPGHLFTSLSHLDSIPNPTQRHLLGERLRLISVYLIFLRSYNSTISLNRRLWL